MPTDFYRLTYPVDADDYIFASPGTPPQLPAGYGWLNNDPDVGVPSAVALPLAPPHPEAGGMMVGTQNDALSGAANRPHAALGQGLDFLDGLIRRAIAIPKYVDGVAPAGMTTLLLAEDDHVWLSEAGDISPYADLFTVLDSSGSQLMVDNDVPCTVTGVVPPRGDGSLLHGFAPGAVTITFSNQIPEGTSYRIVYARRGCLAELPRSALSQFVVRSASATDAAIKSILSDLHAEGGDTWNAVWPVDLERVSRWGLNEVYHRSPEEVTIVVPELGFPTTGDMVGRGSFIYRTSTAPAVYSRKASDALYADNIDAMWKAIGQDATSIASSRNGGSVGFLAAMGYPTGVTNDEFAGGLASFLATAAQKMANTAAYWADLDTQIGWEDDVDVDWDAGVLVVTLTSGRFWWNDGGTKRTSITTGLDMLEIYNPYVSGSKWRMYVIWKLHTTDGTKAYLKDVTGSDATPTHAGFTGKVRWHSTLFDVSAGLSEKLAFDAYNGGSPPPYHFAGMVFRSPPLKATGQAPEDFVGGGYFRLLANGTAPSDYAMRWGGTVRTVDVSGYSAPVMGGSLYGDGSIACADVACADISCTGLLSSGGISGLTVHTDELDTVAGGGVISVLASLDMSGWALSADSVLVDHLGVNVGSFVDVTSPLHVTGEVTATGSLTSSTGGVIAATGVAAGALVSAGTYMQAGTYVTAGSYVQATTHSQARIFRSYIMVGSTITVAAGSPTRYAVTVDMSAGSAAIPINYTYSSSGLLDITLDNGSNYGDEFLLQVRSAGSNWTDSKSLLIQFFSDGLGNGEVYRINADGISNDYNPKYTVDGTTSGDDTTIVFRITTVRCGSLAKKLMLVTVVGYIGALAQPAT